MGEIGELERDDYGVIVRNLVFVIRLKYFIYKVFFIRMGVRGLV